MTTPRNGGRYDAQLYVFKTAARLAKGRQHRRWSAAVNCLNASVAEKEALLTLMLVESTARPRLARLMEWLVVFPLRKGMLGSVGRNRARKMSVGPLQMRGAPFNRRKAICMALLRLREGPSVADQVDELGRYWNGLRADDDAHPIRYSDALALVRPIARRSLDRWSNCLEVATQLGPRRRRGRPPLTRGCRSREEAVKGA